MPRITPGPILFTAVMLISLVNSMPAIAQTTPQLYSGRWTTWNSERYTLITATANLAQHVYRITAPGGLAPDTLRFAIYVDGQPLPSPLIQGGSAVVQGSRIAILQTSGGASTPGSWTVLQESSVPIEQIVWVGYPGLAQDVLLAAFKTEQEFVLTLDNTCTAANFTVSIDGVPVRNTHNQPMVFHRESSILGKGKLVTVRMGGSCPSGTEPARGSFRIRQVPLKP
jgi:hypothetical protein